MTDFSVSDFIPVRYLDQTKRYHSALSPELDHWYCYTVDGGHSILAAIASLYSPDALPSSFLVPIPVKTVVRGYRVDNGFVVVDGLYDGDIGLMVPEEDTEW